MQSLESVPTWLADYLDISLEAGQALLSIVVIFAVLLPVMYFNRERSGWLVEIIVILFLEAFLVGIEWLSPWLLIMTVGMVAIAIAVLGSKAITGD